MLRYETLFLTVPEITADEANAIEKQLDQIVQNAKGNIISFERWGKYKLAYPVRKYEYGVYFLVRFEVDNSDKLKLLENIKNLFSVKILDLVMRFTLQKLNPEASLEYKRGESLEEVPTRDVDMFLKENKMTGLLGKSAYKESGHRDHRDREYSARENSRTSKNHTEATLEADNQVQ